MQRDQCKVGMTVTFGRVAGEKTVGVVEKCNPSKAKVRTTEARGRTPAGTIWNVPYSLLHAEGVQDQTAFPIGQRITGVRLLTRAECESQGWEVGPYSCAVGLILSDGSLLFASQDYEGNGPGALFGRLRTGESFVVSPSEVQHA
jgi:hypothetical protein